MWPRRTAATARTGRRFSQRETCAEGSLSWSGPSGRAARRPARWTNIWTATRICFKQKSGKNGRYGAGGRSQAAGLSARYGGRQFSGPARRRHQHRRRQIRQVITFRKTRRKSGEQNRFPPGFSYDPGVMQAAFVPFCAFF